MRSPKRRGFICKPVNGVDFMKIMRRCFVAFISILLIFMCILPVCAKSKNYNINELKMSIAFPEEMSVVTRKTEGVVLADGVYLRAKTHDNALTMMIIMDENEKTKEIYSFNQMTSEDLSNFKDELSSQGYTNPRKGTYGKVDFLDYTRVLTEGDKDIYTRQSITLINGMRIFIVSLSEGDDFTTEELNLIKGCLESIKFKSIKTEDKKANPLGVIFVILLIIVLIAGIFLAVAYLIGRSLTNRKKLDRTVRRRRENYDVLKSAEVKSRTSNPEGKVTGYKTSGDYFEEGFATSESSALKPVSTLSPASKSDAAANALVSVLKTISLGLKILFTRISYFIQNLSRAIKKSAKSAKKNKKRSRRISKAASKEYDVFRDR